MDERRTLRTTAQHPPLFWRPGSLEEEAKLKQSEAKEQEEVMILTKRS
jgi:hypothetical protein